MPDALELPGMLRAVVPLVSGERLAGFRRGVVNELVAFALGPTALVGGEAASGRLPSLAAIAGALDNLSEPAAGLRGVEPVGIAGRSLHVVDLPAGKVGTAD